MNLYIYKYKVADSSDVSFLPVLYRRKIGNIGKIALAAMNSVYEGNDTKLVFASSYGDLEKTIKLIRQKNEEGEISPNNFSFSVHNSIIGLFSLVNNIHSSYNTISAGENTLAAGVLESIITDGDVLFCYAEETGGLKGIAVSFGEKPKDGAIGFEYVQQGGGKGSLEDFTGFLEGKNDFVTSFYTLKRI